MSDEKLPRYKQGELAFFIGALRHKAALSTTDAARILRVSESAITRYQTSGRPGRKTPFGYILFLIKRVVEIEVDVFENEEDKEKYKAVMLEQIRGILRDDDRYRSERGRRWTWDMVCDSADQYIRSRQGTKASKQATPTPSPVSAEEIENEIPPHSENFLGRTQSIQELLRVCEDERRRIVVIAGPAGIGKTEVVRHFLRSGKLSSIHYEPIVLLDLLYHGPRPFHDFCTQVVQQIKDVLGEDAPSYPQAPVISLDILLPLLRQHRFLIVIDNFEKVLGKHNRWGPGDEQRQLYQAFIQGVMDQGKAFRSCLILVSQERIDLLDEFHHERWHTLEIGELAFKDAKQLLEDAGITGSEPSFEYAIDYYGRNPFELKHVAIDIKNFIRTDERMLDLYLKRFPGRRPPRGEELRHTTFQQCNEEAQEILYLLAVSHQSLSASELADLISYRTSIPLHSTATTVQQLRRKFLLQIDTGMAYDPELRFTLHPSTANFLLSLLIKEIYQEIAGGELNWLVRIPLQNPHTDEFVITNQVDRVVKPLVDELKKRLGAKQIRSCLIRLLDNLRDLPAAQTGYAVGNIINLVAQTEDMQFNEFDFSHLHIRGADCRDRSLNQVDFSGSNLSMSLFTENFGVVHAVACSPISNKIAFGTDDGQIRILKMNGKNRVNLFDRLNKYGSRIWSLSFSQDGNLLCYGGDDGVVHLWDAKIRDNPVLGQHENRIWSVAFGQDQYEHLVASASADGRICIWNSKQHELVVTFTAPITNPSMAFLSVAMNKMGLVAGGSADRSVYLWDFKEQDAAPKLLGGHREEVRTVAFHPEEHHILVSGDNSGFIVIRDIDSGRAYTFRAHDPFSVRCLAFSADGTHLLSAGSDRLVRVWSFKECLQVLYNPNKHMTLSESEAPDKTCPLVKPPENVLLLSGHTNRLWTASFMHQPSSAEAELIVTGGDDQTVRLWDIGKQQTKEQNQISSFRQGRLLQTIQGHTNQVWSLAYSPNGKKLASGSGNRAIRIWDIESGQIESVLTGHIDRVWGVAFSLGLNGRLLMASVSGDTTVKCWQEDSLGKWSATPELDYPYGNTGYSGRMRAVVFNPDGSRMATGGSDRYLRLWDMKTQKVMDRWELGGRIRGVAFSPDGSMLASASEDGRVGLWNLQNNIRNTADNQTIHKGRVRSVTFHPYGEILASAGDDKRIVLWDVRQGTASVEVCRVIEKNIQSQVLSIAFSPDGLQLACGCADGSVLLWDASGEYLGTMTDEENTGRIWSITFNPLDGTLASGNSKGRIVIWDTRSLAVVKTLVAPLLYQGMNITGIQGLTSAQKDTLNALGAIELPR